MTKIMTGKEAMAASERTAAVYKFSEACEHALTKYDLALIEAGRESELADATVLLKLIKRMPAGKQTPAGGKETVMPGIYYYMDLLQTSRTPIHEIAYIVGRVIGYIMLAGIGFVIGQVIRGVIMAFI